MVVLLLVISLQSRTINLNKFGDDYVSFVPMHISFSPDGQFFLVSSGEYEAIVQRITWWYKCCHQCLDRDRLILFSWSTGKQVGEGRRGEGVGGRGEFERDGGGGEGRKRGRREKEEVKVCYFISVSRLRTSMEQVMMNSVSLVTAGMHQGNTSTE